MTKQGNIADAFTLIELLLVLAILGVIMSMVIPKPTWASEVCKH